MEVSIPASSMIVSNNLSMVLEVTALWSLMNDMSNLVSSPRSGLVLSMYVLRVFTGHNTVFGRTDRRKTPQLVCLDVIVAPGWLVKM